MTRVFATARGRLALLFMALFAASGAALVALTYVLVAANVKATDINTHADNAQFLKTCASLGANGAPLDANLKQKCAALLSHNSQALAVSQRADMLQTLAVAAIIALIVLTAVSGVVGWLIAGRILRPLQRITAAARAAGDGDLSGRLALTGPRDELRELADTFDDMLEKLETAFVAQKRFIANASHELRTPLTVIRTTVDVVLGKPSASTDELRRMGEDVRAETEHAGALIDALLTLTRSDGMLQGAEPIELGEVARHVAERLGSDAVTLTVTAAPGAVEGDPSLLQRLVANLVDNAVRYNVPDGTVELTVSTEAESVSVRVVNTGPVVPASELARLFEPFTRLNDRTGDGFGLGLSIVDSIARAHGASVDAVAPESGGLDITVTFPRLPEPVPAA